MKAWDRVIASPHSIAARVALIDEWNLSGNPQARLLELQIQRHRGLGPDSWDRVPREIKQLLREHGHEWAKPFGAFLTGFSYELGLVAGVGMTGDNFLAHGEQVFRQTPVVRLTLSSPADLTTIASVPALAQIRVLSFVRGVGIDDEGIEALTRSPYLDQLRALYVANGTLSERGILQLVSLWPKLPRLIYIDVSGNPGAKIADSRVTEINNRHYIIGQAGEPLLRAAFDATALGYSGQVEWPPLDSTFLFDDDE